MGKTKVKPKNTLLLKCQTANIVSMIVQEYKETFKNIDLETVKSDLHSVEYLMQQVEAMFNDKEKFDPSNLEKLNKNDIVMQILKAIYPSISPTEIAAFENIISFIASNNIIKLEKSVIEKLQSFFSQKSKNRFNIS